MKNKKTENIEKYADCMNDDDAIKITKKYCYDPNAYLVKRNPDPDATMPGNCTTELCLALRMAEGYSLPDFIGDYLSTFWQKEIRTERQYRMPGGNYRIFVNLNKKLPDEKGFIYHDKLEIEFSQAGEFVVGRIRYATRCMTNPEDGSEFMGEPVPVLVQDIWFSVVSYMMAPYMYVTPVEEFSDFIMTTSMEKLSGWLKANDTELPRNVFKLP